MLKNFLFTTFNSQLTIIDQLVIHADIHTSTLEGNSILKLEEYLGSVFLKFSFIIEKLQDLGEGKLMEGVQYMYVIRLTEATWSLMIETKDLTELPNNIQEEKMGDT